MTSTGKKARRQFGTRFAAKRAKEHKPKHKTFGHSTREAAQKYGSLSPAEVKKMFERGVI